MNLHAILATNLEWVLLIDTATTIAFLPVLGHFLVTGSRAGVTVAAALYRSTCSMSGVLTGILDARSSRGRHRQSADAAFMILAAAYLLLAGKAF